MRKNNCPFCKTTLTAATSIDLENPAVPNPGDVSICFECGEILQYTSDMALEPVDKSRLRELGDTDFFMLGNIQRKILKRNLQNKKGL